MKQIELTAEARVLLAAGTRVTVDDATAETIIRLGKARLVAGKQAKEEKAPSEEVAEEEKAPSEEEKKDESSEEVAKEEKAPSEEEKKEEKAPAKKSAKKK